MLDIAYLLLAFAGFGAFAAAVPLI